VVHVIRQAVDALKLDHAVVVNRLTNELTTDEAADLLGVPHAYVLRLLEQEALPSSLVRGRRRVRLADVMAYRERRDAERQQILDDLAQESQEIEQRVG
jgi:excisionase family DNA binding protein